MAKQLSLEEVEHIASLARIGISDEEKARFQKDLAGILDYIQKLQEVDTASYGALGFNRGQKFEAEDVENGSSSADARLLLKMAAETKDGYVKARQILKK